jgi:NAD(P)H-flavin reductase
MLLTKGALAEQSGKVERSGLKEYFSVVEIVAEKDVALAQTDVAIRTRQVVNEVKQAYAMLFIARKATEVHLASDDGSLGEKGFVTDLLARNAGGIGHVVGCGPEPMLHALADLAQRWQTPCHVSLETPMACGVGICFSCVTKVRVAGDWDYRRVCVDGPVFEAGSLAWKS